MTEIGIDELNETLGKMITTSIILVIILGVVVPHQVFASEFTEEGGLVGSILSVFKSKALRCLGASVATGVVAFKVGDITTKYLEGDPMSRATPTGWDTAVAGGGLGVSYIGLAKACANAAATP